MKIKRTILMLIVVSLIAVPALAKNNVPGDLAKPVWAAVPMTFGIDGVTFDWEDVTNAAKYSLDIVAVATVDYWDNTGLDPVLVTDVIVEVTFSFGTSDWNEDMSDSEITIPYDELEYEDLYAAIAAELGVEVDDLDDVVLDELYAKVKALDPTQPPTKRQNNLFSDPLDFQL